MWRAFRRWRDKRAENRRAIPDPLWKRLLARYPFIARRQDIDFAQLRRLCSHFLARKEFSGVRGMTVTDEMAASVAIQATLPVLELDLSLYDGFVGIVMHPGVVAARRHSIDEAGVRHDWVETLSGEAMEGGPMMLAWSEVSTSTAHHTDDAYNVVIHEFAHVLDLGDGVANGMPLLPDRAAQERWQAVLDLSYNHFRHQLNEGWRTVVDPYGASGPEEYFAVASEAFFVTPAALAEEDPALYRLLADYYRQDPAAGLAHAM